VFYRFPARYCWLNLWGHIVEGRARKKEGMDTELLVAEFYSTSLFDDGSFRSWFVYS